MIPDPITVYFDEADESTGLVEALRAEGFAVAVRHEGFAGEDDSLDHAWLVEVSGAHRVAQRVDELVALHGGWLTRADPEPARPVPLPSGPRRVKGVERRSGARAGTPPGAT